MTHCSTKFLYRFWSHLIFHIRLCRPTKRPSKVSTLYRRVTLVKWSASPILLLLSVLVWRRFVSYSTENLDGARLKSCWVNLIFLSIAKHLKRTTFQTPPSRKLRILFLLYVGVRYYVIIWEKITQWRHSYIPQIYCINVIFRFYIFFQKPEFTAEKMASVSVAATSLTKWVHAMNIYATGVIIRIVFLQLHGLWWLFLIFR